MRGTLTLALLGALAAAPKVGAVPPGRARLLLNDGWRYHEGGISFAQGALLSDAGWTRVTLPHTWNAADPFDEAPGYRRGIGWYRRTLTLDPTWTGRRVFLYFEGANQVADVYVNGALAGEHRGGYTAFAVDITPFVHFGESTNLVSVKVDNSQDPSIPPLSVGYALYGGIYRDVWLVATDPVHVAVADHAGEGVHIWTPHVSAERADVQARTAVVNDSRTAAAVRVVTTLVGPDGQVVSSATGSATIASGATDTVGTAIANVARPLLWSPDTPTLYSVRTEVYAGSRLTDRVDEPLGFRWFHFSADSGFALNGHRLELRGTTRHQDREGIGSALSDAQHVQDMQIIKAMGANFVRLAHYPQAPAVLDAADRLGLMIWQEVPVVNYITPDSAFARNAREMLRDMIRQDFDHPSVIVWGLMNEVFLWSPQGARIGRQNDTTYMWQVRDFAQSMNAVAHAEDSTRPTAMAIHASADYDSAGVAEVPDLVGLNRYDGWYSGDFDGFGRGLDHRRAALPGRVFMVSEYGAGSDARVNSLTPERFDFSGQWQQEYHAPYLRQIAARRWFPGAAIWNEFDFSQPEIGGTMPNLNQKGMVNWNRTPKDVYYLYQANWASTPMVHIATHDWTRRAGAGTPGQAVMQPVTVYSNLKTVELWANGRSLGARTPDDVHEATWQVPFVSGANVLEARARDGAKTAGDQVDVQFTLVPTRLAAAPFRDLAVNVGSLAQVADTAGPVWVEDQAYRAGSYGFVGGTARQVDRSTPITGTSLTPLFFTYRDGVTGYRADVPDGRYEVELDLLEPSPAAVAGERVFSISANGIDVVHALDLSATYGNDRAATLRFPVRVSSGAGLRLDFSAARGTAVLSGLRITKK
jgi:beta-galactosidase